MQMYNKNRMKNDILLSLLIIVFATALGACASATPVPTADNPVGLVILSPEDGTTVNTASAEIKGTAPVDTVITIGEEIIVVDESGKFSFTVQLQQGDNEIQILASDADGNKVYKILTVDYVP